MGTSAPSAAALALLTTIATMVVLLRVLDRIAIFDTPNERSSHAIPTLRGGGLAVLFGMLAGTLAGADIAHTRFGDGLIVVVLGFGVLGLADDVIDGLDIGLRASLQAGIATLSLIFLLDGITGALAWKIAVGLAVALWEVAFVNVFNFMDGINGISSFQAIASGAAFALLGAHYDVATLEFGGLTLAVAALAFLPFNFPRARVFLGDVGSYGIGAWLAALTVIALRSGIPVEAVMAPFMIYLADTATTLARRALRGEQWYRPHREHTYQQLVDAGWSQAATALTVFAGVLACSGLGALSLTGSALARAAGDLMLVVLVTAYLALPFLSARRQRSLRSAPSVA